MTVAALVSAVVVGLVVGALGRLAVPGRPTAPLWLTLVVGVVAALAGSVVARLAGANGQGFRLVDVVVQAGMAGVGVVLVAATAGRSDSA
ncbi:MULTISPECIES: transglycosylase [Micromonospora]|uniref:Transglycosylase n=1 Tax=Micromonospora haikouensis TaxID=686309 RepID=A0A0D0WY84_9ACTN|nr:MULTISPECIES: transglycosylase [Micromonospora]KIR62285.1 transglycosylase [Micromonospora haikouensis]OON27410.1 transglycosylase [Micromonospora sp. Rc5]